MEFVSNSYLVMGFYRSLNTLTLAIKSQSEDKKSYIQFCVFVVDNFENVFTHLMI